MTQPDPVLTDQDGSIAIDVPCVSCGYNLRGLRRDGRCPECGCDIANSDHGGLLRYADPTWVSGLHTGATVVLDGVFVLILLPFPLMSRDWRVAALLAAPLALVCALSLRGFVKGLEMLTTPDPRATDWTPGKRMRMTVRWGWAPAIVLSAVLVLVGSFQRASVVFALASVPILAWLVVVVQYLGRLSDRLPSPSIRRLSRYCSVGMVAGLLFVAFMALTSRDRAYVDSVRHALLFLSSPLLFGAVAMMAFLRRYTREFGAAAGQAWGNAAPPN